MNQPSFFDPGYVPNEGEESRDETYREIADQLPERCKIWLAHIVAAGQRGVTIDELSAKTGKHANEFSGRITELKNAKFVRYTEDRRPTRRRSTAAVIVATDRALQQQPSQPELPAVAEETKACELPDANTNTRTPRDTDGKSILHGFRYDAPGIGVVEVVYEVDEDEFYIFRPGAPDKRQPVSLLPPQLEPWVLVG